MLLEFSLKFFSPQDSEDSHHDDEDGQEQNAELSPHSLTEGETFVFPQDETRVYGGFDSQPEPFEEVLLLNGSAAAAQTGVEGTSEPSYVEATQSSVTAFHRSESHVCIDHRLRLVSSVVEGLLLVLLDLHVVVDQHADSS